MKSMKKNIYRKCARWLAGIAVAPVALFFMLVVLLYVPPVQKFVVGKVAESLSQSMGMQISVGNVRLVFPLDLSVNELCARQDGDTLLSVRSLRLSVPLRPLCLGRADVDGFELLGGRLNTKGLIPDTYVRGSVGSLKASLHGVEWNTGKLVLDQAHLNKARLWIALSDTAAVDTIQEPSQWNITARELAVTDSHFQISLPGDSLRVRLGAERMEMHDGDFRLAKGLYRIRQFKIQKGSLRYATRPLGMLPKTGNMAYDSLSPDGKGMATDWDTLPSGTRGLSPSFIQAERVGLQLDSLQYDAASSSLEMVLSRLSLQERCGLHIKQAQARICMDTLRFRATDVRLRTRSSEITAQVDFPFCAMDSVGSATASEGCDGVLSLQARIGTQDIQCIGLGFMPSNLILALPMPDLSINAVVSGGWNAIDIHPLSIQWPGIVSGKVTGQMVNPMEDCRKGELEVDMRLHNFSRLDKLLSVMGLESNGFSIPRESRLKATVTLDGNDYAARLQSWAGKGVLRLNAALNPQAENYQVDLKAGHFPLGQFLPGCGLQHLTGSIQASGHGFNPLQRGARMKARMRVDDLPFNGKQWGRVALDAQLQGGHGDATFTIDNALMKAGGQLDADLADQIRMELTGDFRHIDLKELADLEDTLQMEAKIHLQAFSNQRMTDFGVGGTCKDIRFLTRDRGFSTKDLAFDFSSNPDTTRMTASAGDLQAALGASGPLEYIGASFSRLAEELVSQLKEKQLNYDRLKAVLPEMQINLQVGKDNPVSNLLRYKGYTFSTCQADLVSHPSTGVNGMLGIGGLSNESLMLDTIRVVLQQDNEGLHMNGWVRNHQKRNPVKFQALLDASLTPHDAQAAFKFIDSEGETGIDIGMTARMLEEGWQFEMSPLHPVIAYRTFTVNSDNRVLWGNEGQIRANLDLVADDGTALSLYSEPDSLKNDLTLSLAHVNLGELSEVLPYLPSMKGMLGGDIHIVDDSESLSAMALLNADGLEYDGAYIGSVGLEAVYLPKDGGEHHFSAFVLSDETEVMALEGSYFDEDSGRFEGTATLMDFPLQMLNGFLAGTDIAMNGSVGGQLMVKGDLEKPELNGQLLFDSAHVYSDVYGFDFRMDESPVMISEGRMVLENFPLHSRQSVNPLLLNGNLDLRDLSDIRMDFAMKAQNFELINTKRKMQSLIFGKVYADFIGTVKGTFSNLSIRGKLDVLDRTDMTYILKDSPLTVDDQLHDLVQFVSFADSTGVVDERVEPTYVDLTLGISINNAAHFHCNLSEDGENYVDLDGGGDLTLRMTQQGEMRMTGRFTMESGEMKYSLPIIPLKTFKLAQGSYVEFTGDVMNPTLNIAATERVKATVTENDQPRSVAFDVGVSITQPLENMGLEFTIEAPEDLSMQNQLASMTQAQRGKTAVAMLATGMFLNDEALTTGGSGFKASNALTAFLQSEIQNIAGSALRTIDLTIGMENGTSETGSTTTDYSFEFSKRFWGNRVSVIVGGKVSTGADATNSAESFIDNVAVEYRLDKSATRYVRAFYDRGTQDPFEGQLTKTGAGVVLRRKTNRLGELFIFRNRK